MANEELIDQKVSSEVFFKCLLNFFLSFIRKYVFNISKCFERLLLLLNFYLGNYRGVCWWSTFWLGQFLYFLTIFLFFFEWGLRFKCLSVLYSILKCSCNQMKHFDFCQNKICQRLAWDSILVCYGWNLLSWRIFEVIGFASWWA